MYVLYGCLNIAKMFSYTVNITYYSMRFKSIVYRKIKFSYF